MTKLEKLALDEAIVLAKVYRKDLNIVYRQRLNYHLSINSYAIEEVEK